MNRKSAGKRRICAAWVKSADKTMGQTMKMNALLCAILSASAMLAAAFSARADGGFEQLPADEMLLDNPSWNIAVVTVQEVATNAATGEARLKVEKMLRGKIKAKQIERACWTTPPSEDLGLIHAAHVADGIIHKTSKPNEWYQRSEQMGRHRGPLTTPAPGDKLIVMFLENRDVRKDPIELQGIYRFSEQNQETVLKHMAPAERTGIFQLLAVLYILIVPFVCGYLEAAPRAASRRNSKRRLERKHVPLLVLVQFIAYAFYESGIPSSYNIRIDLIPIVPALAFAAIVGVRSLFPPKKTENGSAS